MSVDRSRPAGWPFTITDPVRAVHYLMERDCPYDFPHKCPWESTVKRVLLAHSTWIAERAAQKGDEDECDPRS